MSEISRPMLGALANEFSSTFGLFEFALKKCKHYDVNAKRDKIDTSWSKFVQANSQINQAFFDRLKADKIAPTIMSDPPKKLGEVNGNLDWLKPNDVVDMEKLYYAVKRVRNNLFHGDKAEWNPNRDTPLIVESLAVIRAILAEAPAVAKAFNDGAMIFKMQLG